MNYMQVVVARQASFTSGNVYMQAGINGVKKVHFLSMCTENGGFNLSCLLKYHTKKRAGIVSKTNLA